MHTLQNIGRPQTSVAESDWKDLSKHASEDAARKAIAKRTSHLSPGSWDDHYRVLAPGGKVCDVGAYLAREGQKQAQREYDKRNR